MKRLFKLLVCLSAVVGCAKEEIVESSGVAGITEITVSLPQTKVAVDENSGKCTWSDGDKNWYFTNIHPKTAEVYPYEVAKMRSRNGHVVIRVKEGGSEFYVYVLDDTDFECRVKQIDGPFSCH